MLSMLLYEFLDLSLSLLAHHSSSLGFYVNRDCVQESSNHLICKISQKPLHISLSEVVVIRVDIVQELFLENSKLLQYFLSQSIDINCIRNTSFLIGQRAYLKL